MSSKSRRKDLEVAEVEITKDRLTSRAGLVFFVAYLNQIGLFPVIDSLFGWIRKSKKGKPVIEIVKQVLCFFADGTSRHITYFDELANDEGYAGTIETDSKDLLSSHSIKRFFKAFSCFRIYKPFRWLLQKLFIWRLHIEKPPVIDLGIDTMVMDNNDAHCRQGVEPTYKKKNGFQPAQMNWGRFIIDAVFRSGSKHSNHGDTIPGMIRNIVGKIRRQYCQDVPVIIRMDSGFFDQKIFKVCEELGIGYICGGKMYEDIKQLAINAEEASWIPCACQDKNYWEYMEFGGKRDAWDQYRRTIYCRLACDENGQMILPCSRPDTIIITNIGQGQPIDDLLRQAGAENYLLADTIVESYHQRGSDELTNRAFKDFGHEQLPFKEFAPNAAWYYMMLLGYFLLEAFKIDVSAPVLPVGAYASTVRRRLIDIAGKIVFHAGKTVLRVSQSSFEQLRLAELFKRCKLAPMIQ